MIVTLGLVTALFGEEVLFSWKIGRRMDRSLARKATETTESDEDAVRRMFSHGFLAMGGYPSHLKTALIYEVMIELTTFAAVHPEGPQKRAFILSRAEAYGEQFAQVVARGEGWALCRDLGWHASVLRRHGVAMEN